MAEAIAVLSFVSAIAALIDIGRTVADRLNDFRVKTHELPQAFKHVQAQIPITIDSLRRTQIEAQAGNLDAETQEALAPALEGCHNQIQRLDEVLRKVLPTKDDSSWARRIKALRSVSKDLEVQALLKEIDRYVSRIMLHNTSRTPKIVQQFGPVQQVFMKAANRDPNFVDRPEIFKELDNNLTTFGRAALAGIGGAG